MKDKLENPKETICMFLYSCPKTIKDINKYLYGYDNKRNSRVPGWIKDLLKKEWIEEHKKFDTDQRKKFLKTKNKCFFDSITQKLKKHDVILTPIEKKKVKTFLANPSFKEIVENIISYNEKSDTKLDFTILKTILGYQFIQLVHIIDFLKNMKLADFLIKDIELNPELYEDRLGRDMLKMGYDTLRKLSCLVPYPNLMSNSLKHFIYLVDAVYEEKIKYVLEESTKKINKDMRDKIKNGNGHGLS